MSAANISGFSKLPDHIQNFLFYRHCRHFPMLLDMPDKCGGPEQSSDVFLLLVIKSSPENYERREVLRKTQRSEEMRLNGLLRAEQNENKDILQWDFDESFFNLTLKQILFLEWMERNCPKGRFVFNGDDDVFANTDGMVEYLQDLPKIMEAVIFTLALLKYITLRRAGDRAKMAAAFLVSDHKI
ncbi:hypothetical protein WMY93_025389 [Mugilogobius chulae]|uniref:Hexosyltransferase n=1 Tax=Mugilogobius chulae TaxID=88201 RepID=A0AAW0NEH1_9GOBI